MHASTTHDRYRGRQIAGLLVLGGGLLATALFRTHWYVLFPTGWWHVW